MFVQNGLCKQLLSGRRKGDDTQLRDLSSQLNSRCYSSKWCFRDGNTDATPARGRAKQYGTGSRPLRTIVLHRAQHTTNLWENVPAIFINVEGPRSYKYY